MRKALNVWFIAEVGAGMPKAFKRGDGVVYGHSPFGRVGRFSGRGGFRRASSDASRPPRSFHDTLPKGGCCVRGDADSHLKREGSLAAT